MTVQWRLLKTGFADGATNMAIDEAIVRALQAGLVPPTLRLYGWHPPCLSLGQAQPAAEVDWAACAALGIDVVRRPTGGRAILHIDELTYSLIAPENHPAIAGDIVTSYRKISRGLIEGLRGLNIPNIHSAPQSPIPNTQSQSQLSPVCFEAPSHYEITVNGQKLVGSAQMRRGGLVLQHGAIPLHGDIARICQVLAAHPDPARVRARATTIEAVTGHTVSFEQAATAIADGFARALEIELGPGALTPQEHAWADELRRDKYARDEWTRRL